MFLNGNMTLIGLGRRPMVWKVRLSVWAMAGAIMPMPKHSAISMNVSDWAFLSVSIGIHTHTMQTVHDRKVAMWLLSSARWV